jgi:hypothetical protein
MGVEYCHYLVTAEPDWLPQPDTLNRILEVLRSWDLLVDEPEVFDLTGGHTRAIPAIPATPPGPGIAVVYPGVEGAAAAALVGPSYYDSIDEEQRYIQRISVVVGSDYRIQSSSEGLFFSVVQPPLEGGREIEPYPEDWESNLHLFWKAYPATQSTTPPRVEIEIDSDSARKNIAFHDYPGFWRGAVVLDCGKDIPAFADGRHLLFCREFVAEIGMAMRARLCEIGEID